MTRLAHGVTGHEVVTDEASVEFWESAGYVQVAKPAAKKAPAKKSASSKNTK